MKILTKYFRSIAFIAVIGFIFACDSVPSGGEPVKWDELKEVETSGRLSITGLEDFEGQFIQAHTSLNDFIYYLVAFNTFSQGYFEGNVVAYSENTVGMVVNGQATLNIYKEYSENEKILYGNFDEDYNNVLFHVGVWNEKDNYASYGTVTVNLANGIGSGVFELKDLAQK